MPTNSSIFLSSFSNPTRLSLEYFIEDGDIQTCLYMLRMKLGEQLYQEKIGDSEEILGAIFEDSTDENWGTIEERWGRILKEYRKRNVEILQRRSELLKMENSFITGENESEYERLGKELETLIPRLLDKINSDVKEIIAGVRDVLKEGYK